MEAAPLDQDVAVAAVGPQQVVRQRLAGRLRRILPAGAERRAEIDGVEIDGPGGLLAPEHVEGMVPDVADVERRRPWQRELHTGVPLDV